MGALRGSIALISDDPGLRLAVAAMLRADGAGGEGADLVGLPSRDGVAGLPLSGAVLVLLDADSSADAPTLVAAATLVHRAPVVVLGTRIAAGERVGAACLAQGAALLWTKRSGPAAPGLAGAEGADLLAALAPVVVGQGG